MNNQKIDKKKTIAAKYAALVHVGEKRALREFSMIKQFLQSPAVQKELKLNEEEVAWLNREKEVLAA